MSAAAASGRKTFASLPMTDQTNEITQALYNLNSNLCLTAINFEEVVSRLDRIANSLELIADELNPDVTCSAAAYLKGIALK